MSAVILAVIVIMWAVVLVPMWLRRHESATEGRSVDRFSSAMRVLSRRQPATPDRRYVVMPRRDVSPSVHVSGAASSRRPAASRPAPSAPPRPKVRPSLAARRRRAFLALGGLVLLTMVLAAAGVVGWPLQIVVDLVLAAFVVHLRTQAKRAAVAARRTRRAATVSTARSAPAASRRAAAGPAPAARPARPAVPSYDEQPVPEPTPAATGTDGRADEWQPVPVPPPTYTMKSRAPQHWTYEAPAADVAEVVEPGAGEQPEERVTAEAAELDDILEHRWAVND